MDFAEVRDNWERHNDDTLFANLWWVHISLLSLQEDARLTKEDHKSLETAIHRIEYLLNFETKEDESI